MEGALSMIAGYPPSPERVDYEIDSYLVSVTCLGLGLVSQFELQPRLESAGLACERHAVALAADAAVAVVLACRALALLVCVNSRRAALARMLRLSVRPAMLFVVSVASLKIAFLVAMYGPLCALFEACYSYLLLGAILVGPAVCKAFRSWGPSGGDASGAEAKATRVLAGFRRFVSADAESGSGAEANIQCAICLDELEPTDAALTTPCGHSFHDACLRRWLTHQAFKMTRLSCALCRQRLSEPLGLQPASGDTDETPPPRFRRIFLDER